MKILAILLSAIMVSVSSVSAGEFDSIVPNKSVIVFNTEKKIIRLTPYNTTFIKTLISRENGKKCLLSYSVFKVSSALIPGGTQSIIAYNASNSVPDYGFYIVANAPYGQGEQLIFTCQTSLSLAQVRNILAEDGIEIKDL